ncbi:MAG: phosphoribosylglycinamide formyltransferase [Gemmatimonadota bacterium]|nr:phosphoribosylglycinamide formyltransferase [Gemmatimonadota bacterium]
MWSRIAVLASGRGSNLVALLEYLDRARDGDDPHVVLVASDRSDAGALDVARGRGIAVEMLTARGADSEALAALLTRHEVDLVVLAGYLRLIPQRVVRDFAGRIVNVHPALLPSFGGRGMYGERVHRAVLASGARISGATVHTVSDEYDRGTILAQWPVPVLASDDPHTLAARVLRVEHLLLPRVVAAMASGRIRSDAPGVENRFLSSRDVDVGFTLSRYDADALSHDIDVALAG